MTRLINSEQKYQNPNFKIKVGTNNKKNPNVIYIQLGTYIKPIETKDSFSEYILFFDKETKRYLSRLIDEKKNCQKDFILVTDIADERIAKNKKSYLDLQIFVKPKEEKKETFKNIAKKIYEDYVTNIISYIETELSINDIECHKTKK
jgi:hypothetical protein